MTSSIHIPFHDLLDSRSKRDSRENFCAVEEFESSVDDKVADVMRNIDSVPIIGRAAGIVNGCAAAVSHITKKGMDIARTALSCDDISMKHIRASVDERIGEITRKLDAGPQAMVKVSKMVSKNAFNLAETARLEMSNGFKKLTDEIQNRAIKQKVTQMDSFIDYFINEKNRIKKLPKEEFITKLEERRGILTNLKESRTPRQDSLHSAMQEIIRNNFAIPSKENDKKAFQALYALFYGTQTYVSIFGFLIESYSYLADHYYQKGDFEKFNHQVDAIKTVFNDFKHSLVGNNYGFVTKLNEIMKAVSNKSFIKNVKYQVYKQVKDRTRVIEQLVSEIKSLNIPLGKDVPGKPTLQFKSPDIGTFGEWKNGMSVRYAVQFEKNGEFSKLGAWSESFTVRNKACPNVRTPIDRQGRNKLVFRKFGNEVPRLVAIIKSSKSDFRDVHRDLYDAALSTSNQSVDNAKKALKNGANINALFELGRTPLHAACISGNQNVMNFLLGYGSANINTKDRKGFTPLHLCAEYRRREMIPEYLKRNADVNAVTTEESYTPLHIAVRNGYKDVVDELMKKKGINVNVKDKNGFAPIHAAVNGDTRMFLALLRRNDVNINIKSNVGLAPAHLAAMKNDFNFMKNLKLHKNFNINLVDLHNMTPMHYAAMLGNVEVIRNNINTSWIDLNIPANENKWTPLHYAIFFKNENAAIELIKNSKVNVNSKASGDVTPLHMAAGIGQGNVVKELLNRNANLEDKTSRGYTPLHAAAMRGKLDVVTELVNKGANVKAKTNSNETSFDLAKKYGRNDVKDFLKSKNGRRFRNVVDSEVAGKDILKSNYFSSPLKEKLFHGFDAVEKPEIPFQSTNLLVSSHTSQSLKRSSVQTIDSNGTLMLLDVLMRKLTKEKYDFGTNEATSELDQKAKALRITENSKIF